MKGGLLLLKGYEDSTGTITRVEDPFCPFCRIPFKTMVVGMSGNDFINRELHKHYLTCPEKETWDANAAPDRKEPSPMANVKTTNRPTQTQREQLAEAAAQGFLDSVLASDLATAATNGYVAGKITDTQR